MMMAEFDRGTIVPDPLDPNRFMFEQEDHVRIRELLTERIDLGEDGFLQRAGLTVIPGPHAPDQATYWAYLDGDAIRLHKVDKD